MLVDRCLPLGFSRDIITNLLRVWFDFALVLLTVVKERGSFDMGWNWATSTNFFDVTENCSALKNQKPETETWQRSCFYVHITRKMDVNLGNEKTCKFQDFRNHWSSGSGILSLPRQTLTKKRQTLPPFVPVPRPQIPDGFFWCV